MLQKIVNKSKIVFFMLGLSEKPKEQPARKPATHGNLVALTGAVLIHTEDGNVVLTPQLAKDLAQHLPKFAKTAEDKKHE